jgi:hypothetical protein
VTQKQVEAMAKTNPANPPEKEKAGRRRIPMSIPQQKLSVPEIPGYHLHWFVDSPGRIKQALAAGYEFVDEEEVSLNTFGIACGESDSGNTDMGSRVSIPSGAVMADGAERHYLMKLRQELRDEDTAAMAELSERTAAVLRGERGLQQQGADNTNTYTRGENRNMFTPRRS